jgi:hypothetical protein
VPDLPLADRHETVLPEVPDALRVALDEAGRGGGSARRDALASLAAADPTVPEVWGRLAAITTDPVERYAYARVGYHRGLDTLRANGWGGVGLVRWSRPSNRGFLACLATLRDAARAIGETREVERIDAFLRDLDPDWDDALVDG